MGVCTEVCTLVCGEECEAAGKPPGAQVVLRLAVEAGAGQRVGAEPGSSQELVRCLAVLDGRLDAQPCDWQVQGHASKDEQQLDVWLGRQAQHIPLGFRV